MVEEANYIVGTQEYCEGINECLRPRPPINARETHEALKRLLKFSDEAESSNKLDCAIAAM